MSAEWVMAACAVIGLLGGALTLFWRIAYWLGQSRRELKWQSETLLKLAHKSGSIPPPRNKLMTLDDPSERIDP